MEGGGGGVQHVQSIIPYTLPSSFTMEDKYIGLALALGGTFLIGYAQYLSSQDRELMDRSSFIITKKVHPIPPHLHEYG